MRDTGSQRGGLPEPTGPADFGRKGGGWKGRDCVQGPGRLTWRSASIAPTAFIELEETRRSVNAERMGSVDPLEVEVLAGSLMSVVEVRGCSSVLVAPASAVEVSVPVKRFGVELAGKRVVDGVIHLELDVLQQPVGESGGVLFEGDHRCTVVLGR